MDRLQLVLVYQERALVVFALLVADEHPILALGTGGREHEMRVEAAELAELDLLLADQPVAAVEDLDRVLLVLLDRVRVVGRVAQQPAEVNDLSRPIGRPVGVDVAFVRQPPGHAHAL